MVDATTAATSKGFALQAADGSKVQKNLGEAVEVVGADSNITTKVVSGKVAIELNKNLNNLTGITVNDGTDGTNGSTVIGKDGLSVKDGSGTTIAGVDNTALTVKDAAGVNAETSINKAINTLNASQGETDKFAVKYDKTGTTPNYDSVTFTSTTAATGVKDTTTGKITTTGGTSLNNVASSGDYTDVANAGKGVNAGDLNNAVVDATNAVTDKGLIFGANAGTDHTAKLGTKVTVKGADTNTDFTKFDGGTNLMTQVDTKGNITVALKKDLSVDSLTAGTAPGNTTTLNKDGVTTTGSLNVVDKTTGDTIASLDSTALSVDGNKYTSVNEAINALNKSQGEISDVSVKYDNPAIKDKVTLEGTNGTTITNLKGGEVSLTSKDAVNGSQLYGTYIAMVDALGGNSSYNSDGTVTLPTYAVNGKDYKNVGAALSALDAGWTLNSNGVAGAAIKAGDTVDIGTASTENNLAVVKTGNTIDFSLNKDLKGLTSVETTDGAGNTSTMTSVGTKVDNAVGDSTIYGANGSTITGSNGKTVIIASDKIDVGGNTINNVADAVAKSDATNLGQVEQLIGDTTGNVINKGFGLTAQDGQTVQKKLGEAVDIIGDDKNISTAVKDGKVTVQLADNLNVNSLTTGDTIINNSGINIGQSVQLGNTGLVIAGGPSVTTAGINAGNKTITNVANGVNTSDAVNKGQLDTAINDVQNKVDQVSNNAVQYDNANKDSVTLSSNNGNGTQLNNVADGTVAQGSKDAVNGGQLWDVKQQVDQNTGDINNIKNDINNGTVGLVKQTDKDGIVTVAKDSGGTKVSVAGTSGDRIVTGVAAGKATNDAVNVGQLDTVAKFLGGGAGYDNITQSFTAPSYNVGGNKFDNVGGAIDALNQADQTLNTKIDNVSNKLDDAFRITNNKINDVEQKANAGIAAAMALESAPYIAGKYTYAAGAAYHGGENAVGVTLRKTADNGRWSITGGIAAASQGDPSVRIGISGVID